MNTQVERVCAHHDHVVCGSSRDRNRDGVRPIGLCHRTHDKHDEPNSTARFTSRPARRRSAEHGRCERIGKKRGWKRVERIVGLGRAVRTRLYCALAEAARGGRKLGWGKW